MSSPSLVKYFKIETNSSIKFKLKNLCLVLVKSATFLNVEVSYLTKQIKILKV